MKARVARRFACRLIALCFILFLILGGSAPAGSARGITSHPSAFRLHPSLAFLPVALRDYCGGFLDRFEDPSSGWSLKSDEYVTSVYIGGEFQVIGNKAGQFFLFRSPACDLEDYSVEVEARWVSKPGQSYGLLFGIKGGFDQLYLMDVNTQFSMFRLLRLEAGQFVTLIAPTLSAALQFGNASNHLKVIREGSQISIQINGILQGSWVDAAIPGEASLGIVSSTGSAQPKAEARFDNFALYRLPGEHPGQATAGEVEPPEPANFSRLSLPSIPSW